MLGLDAFETAQRYVNLSVYLYSLLRYAEAWLVAQRALLLLTVLGGAKHPEIATLHITLSKIAIELRDANAMIHHANEAQKIRVAAYGSDHEIVGDVHYNTAFLYHRIGRSQIASRHVLRASSAAAAAPRPLVCSNSLLQAHAARGGNIRTEVRGRAFQDSREPSACEHSDSFAFRALLSLTCAIGRQVHGNSQGSFSAGCLEES